MVLVMILIRIISGETSAARAAGDKCFFVHYLCEMTSFKSKK